MFWDPQQEKHTINEKAQTRDISHRREDVNHLEPPCWPWQKQTSYKRKGDKFSQTIGNTLSSNGEFDFFCFIVLYLYSCKFSHDHDNTLALTEVLSTGFKRTHELASHPQLNFECVVDFNCEANRRLRVERYAVCRCWLDLSQEASQVYLHWSKCIILNIYSKTVWKTNL